MFNFFIKYIFINGTNEKKTHSFVEIPTMYIPINLFFTDHSILHPEEDQLDP